MAKTKAVGQFKTITRQKRTGGGGKSKKKQCEELPFDERARAEYLTGFHKRNLLKKKKSQEKAALAAKEERSSARRQKREKLKLVDSDMQRIDDVNRELTLQAKMKVITVD